LRAPIVVVLAVLRDLIRIGFRTRAQIIAENLFLRRQLALYQERKTRRRRPTPPAKLALVVLSRFFPWAPALAIVQSSHSFDAPSRLPTVLALEIAPARSATTTQEPADADPHDGRRESELGEGRIADEMSLKLGLLVDARTVGKYLKKASRPRPPRKQ
jgi:hypothetical protein